MPTKLQTPVTGEIYHVFNRGVDKRDVFLDRSDFDRFYKSLVNFNQSTPVGSLFELEYGRQNENDLTQLAQIHAYCLLPNHFHLILSQLVDGGISELMKRVSGGYTSYFNEKYERSGALFQGRYKRVNVSSNKQFLFLAAYVNLNYVVHDFQPEHEGKKYRSSLKVYTGEREEKHICTARVLQEYGSVENFLDDTTKTADLISKNRKLNKEYEKLSLLE